MPLVSWLGAVNSVIIVVFVFRDKSLSSKDQNHQNNQLEDSLTDNVLDHGLRNDALRTIDRLSI